MDQDAVFEASNIPQTQWTREILSQTRFREFNPQDADCRSVDRSESARQGMGMWAVGGASRVNVNE